MSVRHIIKPNVWRRTPLGKYLRYIPRIKQLSGTFLHKKIGDRFLRSDYWEPERGAMSRGFACGLFCAMLPIPWQMIPSGILAILFRGNIPLALAAVWITNPVTHPLVIFFQLWLGSKILGVEGAYALYKNEGFVSMITNAPLPLTIGVVITAFAMLIIGYFGMWFAYNVVEKIIMRQYRERIAKRSKNA